MSLNKKSIIELANQFKQMEVKYGLFKKTTTDGIYFWDVLRYTVYMTVLSKYGIYENVGIFLDKPGDPLWKRVAKIVRLIPKYVINEIRLQFFLPKNARFAILLVSRFEDQQGNPTDLLLKDIYDEVKKDAFVMEYFRHPCFSWRKRNIGKRYFLFPLELSLLLGNSPKDDWTEVEKIINDEFNLNISWKASFDMRMEQFRKSYSFFKRLFKKIKPEYLFFQSEPKGMIAAANEQGIVTLDLQHGHTNDADMMYSYPPGVSLNHVTSVPKIFLSLGAFWNAILSFPNKIVTSGSSYFYVSHEDDVNVRTGIMAVSSMFIHEFLKEQIAKLSANHPELTFYYKLHSNQMHEVSETKIFFKSCSNVQVIYTESSVTEIMDHCFAIVLIQSSVAYQALQKGLRAFIFKKDYYEASYDIFEEESVILVDNWKELSTVLRNKKSDDNGKSTIFFEEFKPCVIRDLCSKGETRNNLQ
jgi:hypothetical protein